MLHVHEHFIDLCLTLKIHSYFCPPSEKLVIDFKVVLL